MPANSEAFPASLLNKVNSSPFKCGADRRHGLLRDLTPLFLEIDHRRES
jgi:hypothetical protein